MNDIEKDEQVFAIIMFVFLIVVIILLFISK